MKLYRLSFAVVVVGALLSGPGPAALAAPNVVILIADDMGWADVGYHGSEIRTPTLDRLAAEGVKLERFYAQAVCSPTRAALMTGRSPVTTGVAAPFDPWFSEGLALDEKLLPQYLREAGYSTHAVGKWHLGPNEEPYHPLNRGFDSYYGNLNGYMDYETHAVFGRIDWQRDGTTVYEEGYSTHLIAREAERIIRERDRERPLFLYVTFNAPHTPLQAPAATIAEYADIEDEHRRVYAAMVTELDRAIDSISATLAEEGIQDETLLMFFSDNGGNPRLGASNRPLRGGKTTPFEGGLRVPAFLSWPGTLEPGRVFEQRMTVMDVLPTLVAAAEIDPRWPKPIEGQDLWPALAHGATVASRSVLLSNFQGGEFMHAYFKDQWKLVRGRDENGTVRDFLFEILEDPYEQHDLAGEYPEVLESLVAELEAIPKVEPLTLGETPPDFSAPGAPNSIEPDPRPPIATPYAESGPVPYPPRNYPEVSPRP